MFHISVCVLCSKSRRRVAFQSTQEMAASENGFPADSRVRAAPLAKSSALATRVADDDKSKTASIFLSGANATVSEKPPFGYSGTTNPPFATSRRGGLIGRRITSSAIPSFAR